MLNEAGFVDAELVDETGFNSSPVTRGVLFRARKSATSGIGRVEMEPKDVAMTGDGLQFHKIHDLCRPKITRYLTRLVGRRDAEDVTQEVFMKVDQALKTFRGESQLSTWIYRIATNAALDKLRSPSFRQTGQKSLSEESASEDLVEIVDKDAWTGEKKPSVETSLIRKEMNECIRGIVEKLPRNYRTAVVLSELEGFRDDEIAEILGVSVQAAKIRLHRGRTRLKKELEAHCNFYRDERNEFACDLKRSSESKK